jgi:hypothetical protein
LLSGSDDSRMACGDVLQLESTSPLAHSPARICGEMAGGGNQTLQPDFWSRP